MDTAERENLQKTLGAAARAARERLGLTQAEVAKEIDVTPEQYGRIERGTMLPSTTTLRALALALGTSADVLLGLSAAGTPPEANLSPARQQLLSAVQGLPEVKVEQLASGLKLILQAPGGE